MTAALAPGTYVELDDAWADPGWTRVPNSIVRCPTLSLGAKGLVALLASNRPGHRMTIPEIIALSSDGRDVHRNRFTELQRAGYLTKRQERDNLGRLGVVIFRLHVTPVEPGSKPRSHPAPENPSTANPTPVDPSSSKKTQILEDLKKEDLEPLPDAAASSGADDQPELALPGLPPPVSKRIKPSHDGTDAAFELWWKVYPRKTKKPDARKAWNRVFRERRADVETLMLEAKRYAGVMAGSSYIKYPATWLNNDCWNDDVIPPSDVRPAGSNGHRPGGDITSTDGYSEGPLR